MKSLLTTLIVVLNLSLLFSQPQESAFIAIGGSGNKYIGGGEYDNLFKMSYGYQAELGIYSKSSRISYVYYGFAQNFGQNVVGKSIATFTNTVPFYTEVRFLRDIMLKDGEKNIPAFWFLGFDYNRMRFEGTNKPDSQYYLSCGGGFNIPLDNQWVINCKAKPYIIFSNSLNQNLGFALQLNIQRHSK